MNVRRWTRLTAISREVPVRSVATLRRGALRRGALLVAALVCLVVVMLIGSALITTVLRQHRQQQQEEATLQAFWLAESAVQRATSRLATSRDYTGETWRVDAVALSGHSPGVAVIRVEKQADDESSRQIIVEAVYPQDSPHRVVQRRRITVPLPVAGESS